MNYGMLVPFFLVASAKRSRRSRLAEAMIPTMIPLPPSQQVAVSAVVADQQVRREDRRVVASQQEQGQLLAELADHIKDAKISNAELDRLPRLKATLASRPDLRARYIAELEILEQKKK